METAYPRIEHRFIDNFARPLKELLEKLGTESTHISGESFGSLVTWQFGLANPARVRSITLVSGFSLASRFRVAAFSAARRRGGLVSSAGSPGSPPK